MKYKKIKVLNLILMYEKLDLYIEVAVIQTYETMYSLIMIFE